MPPIGNISSHALRCLENLAVAGPSTAVELKALDPKAPDHRQTIKNLEQSKYVVAGDRLKQSTPASYSLTEKARRLLAGHSLQRADAVPKTSTRPVRRSFANAPRSHAAAPVTIGSMTTGRMVHACADMLAPAIRPGAEQALEIPSRVNDVLHFRDGRRVCIHTNLDL